MGSLYEEVQIILHGIWNRRWLALAVAWITCLLGWVVVSLIPNSYESRARVVVETSSLLPGTIGITPAEQQKAIDDIRQTLVSADNLVKVVQGTELATTIANDADVGAKVGMLRENIRIIAQQDNLLEISAVASDRGLSDGANARLSAAIVQKLIDIMLERNVDGGRSGTEGTLKFVDAQIAGRAKELAAVEQRRTAFEQKYLGVLPGVGSIADRLNAARSEISQIDSQLVSAQSALAALNAQMAATPSSISTPGFAGTGGGGGSALASAQAELAQARARGWTDSHPDVVALKRQIEGLAKLGGGSRSGVAGTQTPNPAYMSLRSLQAERGATVAALQARKNQLQGDVNAMLAKQVQEPGLAAEQDRINRDYDAVKAQYDKLLADREEIRLRGDAATNGQVMPLRVLDPPGVPSVPTSPNRPLLLIAVLIAGVAAGIGCAFLLGQVQTTFATAARLERASGIPVIGSISRHATTTQITLERRRLRQFAGASAGLCGLCLLLLVVEFVQRGLAA